MPTNDQISLTANAPDLRSPDYAENIAEQFGGLVSDLTFRITPAKVAAMQKAPSAVRLTIDDNNNLRFNSPVYGPGRVVQDPVYRTRFLDGPGFGDVFQAQVTDLHSISNLATAAERTIARLGTMHEDVEWTNTIKPMLVEKLPERLAASGLTPIQQEAVVELLAESLNQERFLALLPSTVRMIMAEETLAEASMGLSIAAALPVVFLDPAMYVGMGLSRSVAKTGIRIAGRQIVPAFTVAKTGGRVGLYSRTLANPAKFAADRIRDTAARNVIEGFGISALQEGARVIRDTSLTERDEISLGRHFMDLAANTLLDSFLPTVVRKMATLVGVTPVERATTKAMIESVEKITDSASTPIRSVQEAVTHDIAGEVSNAEMWQGATSGRAIRDIELNRYDIYRTPARGDVTAVEYTATGAVVTMHNADNGWFRVEVGASEAAGLRDLQTRAGFVDLQGNAHGPQPVDVEGQPLISAIIRADDVTGLDKQPIVIKGHGDEFMLTMNPDNHPSDFLAAAVANGTDPLRRQQLFRAYQATRRDYGVTLDEVVAFGREVIDAEARIGRNADRQIAHARAKQSAEMTIEGETAPSIIERVTSSDAGDIVVFKDRGPVRVSADDAAIALERLASAEETRARARRSLEKMGESPEDVPTLVHPSGAGRPHNLPTGVEPVPEIPGALRVADMSETRASDTVDFGRADVMQSISVRDLGVIVREVHSPMDARITVESAEAMGGRGMSDAAYDLRNEFHPVDMLNIDAGLHNLAVEERLTQVIALEQELASTTDAVKRKTIQDEIDRITTEVEFIETSTNWKQNELIPFLQNTSAATADDARALIAKIRHDRGTHLSSIERGATGEQLEWDHLWISHYDKLEEAVMARGVALLAEIVGNDGRIISDAASTSRLAGTAGEDIGLGAISRDATRRRLGESLGIRPDYSRSAAGDVGVAAPPRPSTRDVVRTFDIDEAASRAGISTRHAAAIVDTATGATREVSPREFSSAIRSNSFAATLDQHTPGQLSGKKWRLFGLPHTNVFWALNEIDSHWAAGLPGAPAELQGRHVNATGVMNNDSIRGVATPASMLSSIENGATVLDAYDVGGFLPNRYGRFGWKEAYRTKYDPSFLGDTPEARLAKQAALVAAWETQGFKPQYGADGFLTNGPDVVVMTWRGSDAERQAARATYLRTGSVDQGGASAAFIERAEGLLAGDVGRGGEAGGRGVREAVEGRPAAAGDGGVADVTEGGPGGSLAGDDRASTRTEQVVGRKLDSYLRSLDTLSARSLEVQRELEQILTTTPPRPADAGGGRHTRRSRTLDELDVDIKQHDRDPNLAAGRSASGPKRMRDGTRYIDQPAGPLSPEVQAARRALIQDGDGAADWDTATSGLNPEQLARALEVNHARGKDDIRFSPYTDDYLRDALSLGDEFRYWYERYAEMWESADGVLRKFSPELREAFNNILAATSQRTKVKDNFDRTLAIMSEVLRDVAVETDVISVKTVADALMGRVSADSRLKTGSFQQTFAYLMGMIDRAPMSTNDAIIAGSLGLRTSAFADGVLYEAASRYFIQLSKTINSRLNPGEELYTPWQIQALVWTLRQKERERSTYNNAFDEIIVKLEKAGAVLPIDENGIKYMTPDTLKQYDVSGIIRPSVGLHKQSMIAEVTAGHFSYEMSRAEAIAADMMDLIDVDPKLENYIFLGVGRQKGELVSAQATLEKYKIQAGLQFVQTRPKHGQPGAQFYQHAFERETAEVTAYNADPANTKKRKLPKKPKKGEPKPGQERSANISTEIAAAITGKQVQYNAKYETIIDSGEGIILRRVESPTAQVADFEGPSVTTATNGDNVLRAPLWLMEPHERRLWLATFTTLYGKPEASAARYTGLELEAELPAGMVEVTSIRVPDQHVGQLTARKVAQLLPGDHVVTTRVLPDGTHFGIRADADGNMPSHDVMEAAVREATGVADDGTPLKAWRYGMEQESVSGAEAGPMIEEFLGEMLELESKASWYTELELKTLSKVAKTEDARRAFLREGFDSINQEVLNGISVAETKRLGSILNRSRFAGYVSSLEQGAEALRGIDAKVREWSDLNAPRAERARAKRLKRNADASADGLTLPPRPGREVIVSKNATRRPVFNEEGLVILGDRTGKRHPVAVATATEYGVTFKTGQPVEFTYMRNMEAAPKLTRGGSRGEPDPFQQKIEPAGRYMIAASEATAEKRPKNWATGKQRFENPLVIHWNSAKDGGYDEGSWKRLLWDRYGHKSGKALTDAIRRDGFDGIVTVRDGSTSEIVDIGPRQTTTRVTLPPAPTEGPGGVPVPRNLSASLEARGVTLANAEVVPSTAAGVARAVELERLALSATSIEGDIPGQRPGRLWTNRLGEVVAYRPPGTTWGKAVPADLPDVVKRIRQREERLGQLAAADYPIEAGWEGRSVTVLGSAVEEGLARGVMRTKPRDALKSRDFGRVVVKSTSGYEYVVQSDSLAIPEFTAAPLDQPTGPTLPPIVRDPDPPPPPDVDPGVHIPTKTQDGRDILMGASVNIGDRNVVPKGGAGGLASLFNVSTNRLAETLNKIFVGRRLQLSRLGDSPSPGVKLIAHHMMNNITGHYQGVIDGRIQGTDSLETVMDTVGAMTDPMYRQLLVEAATLSRADLTKGPGLTRRQTMEIVPLLQRSDKTITHRIDVLSDLAEKARLRAESIDDANFLESYRTLEPADRAEIDAQLQGIGHTADTIAPVIDRLLQVRRLGEGSRSATNTYFATMMDQLAVFRLRDNVDMQAIVDVAHAFSGREGDAPNWRASTPEEISKLLNGELKLGQYLPDGWHARAMADEAFAAHQADVLKTIVNREMLGHAGRQHAPALLAVRGADGRGVFNADYQLGISRFRTLVRKIAALEKLRIIEKTMKENGYLVDEIEPKYWAPKITTARFTSRIEAGLGNEIRARVDKIREAISQERVMIDPKLHKRHESHQKMAAEQLLKWAGVEGQSTVYGREWVEVTQDIARAALLGGVQVAQAADFGAFVAMAIAAGHEGAVPTLLGAMKAMARDFRRLVADPAALGDAMPTLRLMELLLEGQHGQNARLLQEHGSAGYGLAQMERIEGAFDADHATKGLLHWAGSNSRRLTRSAANLTTIGTMALTRRNRHWIYEHHRMVSINLIPKISEALKRGNLEEAMQAPGVDRTIALSILDSMPHDDIHNLADLIQNDKLFTPVGRDGEIYYLPTGMAALSADPEVQQVAKKLAISRAGGEAVETLDPTTLTNFTTTVQNENSLQSYAKWLNNSIKDRIVTPQSGSRFAGADQTGINKLAGFLYSFIAAYENLALKTTRTSAREGVALYSSMAAMSIAVWAIRGLIKGDFDERYEKARKDPYRWMFDRFAWGGGLGMIGEEVAGNLYNFASETRRDRIRAGMGGTGLSLPIMAGIEETHKGLATLWSSAAGGGVSEDEFKRMWATFSFTSAVPYQAVGRALQQLQVPGYDDAHPLRDMAMQSDLFTVRRGRSRGTQQRQPVRF